jgi:hypothetical protein
MCVPCSPQEEEEGEEREKLRQSETYTVVPPTMHRLPGLLDRVDEVSSIRLLYI